MRLLHLSDVHVTDPDAAIARFADGEQRLAAVVDHLIDSRVSLDAVVLTGDLVDHGTPEEYRRLAGQLRRLPCPWFALPGNHDRGDVMLAEVLGGGATPTPAGRGAFDRVVDLLTVDGPVVRLVMVDSSRPGHHDGHWSGTTLEWLDRTLAELPEQPTLVCTHHPPVSTGLWHMDYGGARGGDRLAEVISAHPQVEAVLCGHVHRRLVVRWAGTLLCCAPSLTYLTEALLDDDEEPVLHDGLPELPLYRFIDSRFTVDSLDWQPGRTRVEMRSVLGDQWDAYREAARSGSLPHDATGH